MTKTETWGCQHEIETSAAPDVLWALFRDVEGWRRWNAGIERIELRGPFAAGTELLMQPPGQPAFTSRLVEVVENRTFVDETRLDDLVVRVAHRLEAARGGRTRIVYLAHVSGPGAAEVGAAVTADFPDVLAALVREAEGLG